jgi:hypothetical protein
MLTKDGNGLKLKNGKYPLKKWINKKFFKRNAVALYLFLPY